MDNGIFENCMITKVMNAVAAGQTDQTTDEIDMAGYDWLIWIASIGAITSGAATTMVAKAASTSGGSLTALTGGTVTIADDQDNKLCIIEVLNPQTRYHKAVITRATQDSVINCVIAIYGRGPKPVTQGSTVMAVSKQIIGV